MSFWSRAGLLALGAAAGYVASRRGPQIAQRATDLMVRPAMDPQTRSTAPSGPLERFLGSSVGAPVRRAGLGALRFAATVRAGMQEKEQELTERYAHQQQVPREGRQPEPAPWRAAPAGHAVAAPARDADLPPGFLTGEYRTGHDRTSDLGAGEQDADQASERRVEGSP